MELITSHVAPVACCRHETSATLITADSAGLYHHPLRARPALTPPRRSGLRSPGPQAPQRSHTKHAFIINIGFPAQSLTEGIPAERVYSMCMEATEMHELICDLNALHCLFEREKKIWYFPR